VRGRHDRNRSLPLRATTATGPSSLESVSSDSRSRRLDAVLERRLQQSVIGDRQPGPVDLADYDPEWPERFARICEQLTEALGARARTIEHIGSTAVPGLPAKPIIDVLVTVDDVEAESSYAPAMVALGYTLRVREAGHRMFRPDTHDVHVHVSVEGSREHRDYLLLRDWLRTAAADRAAYADLKRRLAREEWPDVNYYAEAKGPLIAQILKRAATAARRRRARS
jgi:GrpB-like predicted nucleotidyltransferase (UPF0157 family)